MKPIVYSRHARRTLRFWDIDPDDVALTIEHPDSVVPSEKGRFNATRRLAQGYLRVTYKKETDRLLIITVTPRRRPW